MPVTRSAARANVGLSPGDTSGNASLSASTTDSPTTEFNCKACKGPDHEDSMVACDTCSEWHHFKCAGVDDSIKGTNTEWNCNKCLKEKERVTHLQKQNGVVNGQNASDDVSSSEVSEMTLIPQSSTAKPPDNKTTRQQKFCAKCTLPCAGHMLTCTKCKSMFHAICVGIDNVPEIHAYVWYCDKCSESVTAKTKSNKTSSSTSSRLRREKLLEEQHQLEREIMEKEKALQDKIRNDEYELAQLKLRAQQIAEKRAVNENASTCSSEISNVSKPKSITKPCPPKLAPFLEFQEGRKAIPNVTIGKREMYDNSKNEKCVTTVAPNNTNVNSFAELFARQTFSKDLPIFDGKPTEWPVFFATFTSSTKLGNLSNVDNLPRLQRCLKGDARQKVQLLLIEPDGVPEIIDTLKKCYGQPRMIIENALNELRQQPKIKPDDLQSMIDFSLVVKNTCALIKMSELAQHLRSPTLVQEVVDKLPTAMQLKWAKREAMYSEPDLRILSDWLTERADLATKIVPLRIDGRQKRVTNDNKFESGKQFQPNNQRKAFGHHAHMENPTGNSSQTNPQVQCKLCKGFHSLSKCKQFLELKINKRWEFVKSNRVCKRCLKNHHFMQCKDRTKCGVDECTFSHHQLLHSRPDSSDKVPNQIPPKADEAPQVVGATSSNNKSVLFRIAPVVLHGPDSSIETYAFFDDGSSVTLIEESLVNALKVTGPATNLCLRWTNDESRTEFNSQTVNIGISSASPSSKKLYQLKGVRTVASLSLPSQSVNMAEMIKEYPYLTGIPIESLDGAVPRLLIGVDNWHEGMTINHREGMPDQPFAAKTRLGWVVSGPSKVGNVSHINHLSHVCECNEDSQIHKLVKDYFAQENMGLDAPHKILVSKDDERALSIMENTTARVNDRFQTGLLWREDVVTFPPSYNMARRRMECLEAKMDRDPVLSEKMHELISDYVRKGYAQKLSANEVNEDSRSWYLPIFTIKNPNKPNKFRAVWDAAARVNGVSLNDKLLKGPDQLTSLLEVLFRFRQKRVAISGDIREMYHQVLVIEKDRNSQRFLWRESKDQPPDVYIMNVMTFGASCSPASAQYIKNRNAMEHKLEYPDAHDAIVTNHYVDDWLQSVDSVEEAVQLVQDVTHVHSKAGFHICKWMSNSDELLQRLKTEKTEEVRDMSENGSTKVLGMLWSTTTDQFQYFIDYNRFDEGIINLTRRPTKRELLRMMMTIYDPMGLIAPFLIYIKIILQEVWRSGVEWDEEIKDAQYTKWKKWLDYLSTITQVRIPRAYNIPINTITVQLHIFVDGSENAYASVAYFRSETDEEVKVSLVGAKSKVVPLRALSIPRIELEAALLGTRFASAIMKAHTISISSRHFWTDSSTVIRWLQSDHRKYKQFVAHRVSEILEVTDVNEWKWLSTKNNVADEATKWKPCPNLKPDSRWINGPEFLYGPQNLWPMLSTKNLSETEIEIRVVKSVNHITENSTTLEAGVPDFERFDSWKRLRRVQGFVCRYVENLRAIVNDEEVIEGPLTVEDFKRAENVIFRAVQQKTYAREIIALADNPPQPIPRKSPIYKLSPIIDKNGVLRHKTRISKEYGVKLGLVQPIILPRKHVVTDLVLMSYHQKYKHQYDETAINEIKQRFVISHLRTAFKSVVMRCQHCKIKNAKPRVPEMAPLPKARLGYMMKPFSYTGVDLFGPMEIVLGRRVEKRWGVIFTCLSVRAVHIEIAHSLSTDSFIMCMRNFIARRGCPVELYCDNGTNFHGADNELRRLKELANKEEFSSIKFLFNPPLSPHMGGAWERLVRSIKTTLCEILPTKRPSDEVLRSALIEAEMIINSRPLSYIPTDPDEPEALTPNHFLLGSSNGVKALGECADNAMSLRNNYKAAQHIATMFWHRWLKEYLPTITRRTKWFDEVPEVKVDDAVVICDNNVRNSWKRGIVAEVFRGRDGKVRSAVIRTNVGNYTRPVSSIAVLDVKKEDEMGIN